MSNKRPHPYVEIPLLATFACFSAVMVYLTGHKTLVLCLLHVVITATLSAVVLAKFGVLGETLPGIGHIVIGGLAFVHAMGTLINEFTTQDKIPLGRAPLNRGRVNGGAEPVVDNSQADLTLLDEMVLNLP
jgi:hypothetical protein